VNQSALAVEHLFRHQSGRMIATLTRIFGPRRLDLAEEVVQDALLKALELWPFQGIPENPSAWLIQVAKNRALDAIRRETSLAEKLVDVTRLDCSARNWSGQVERRDVCYGPELPEA